MCVRYASAFAVFALVALAGADARAQIVSNGSFNGTFPGAWTNNGTTLNTSGGQAGGGDNYVTFNSGDTLQQSVSLSAASSFYTLQFYINRVSGSAASIAFALINGANTTVFSGTAAAGSGWNSASSFTSSQALANGTYTLRFSATGTNSGQNAWSVGLDTISLVAVPGPVPGAGLLSFCAGILAIGATRKRLFGNRQRSADV